MTDKTLAYFREQLERQRTTPGEYGLTIGEQRMLMREVDRLRGELGECLSEIAQAMAESGHTLPTLPVEDARLALTNIAGRLQKARHPVA